MKKSKILLIVCIILAITFAVGAVFLAIEMLKPKSTTTIGKVVYVFTYYHNECDSFEDRAFIYYLYIKPLGNAENQDWILLTVTNETNTESEKNTDVSKMPELKIGAIVEVVRNVDIDKPNCQQSFYLCGFFAESIKVVDNYNDNMESEAVPLVANPKYEYGLDLLSDIKSGTLIGIIPINAPIKGYIIYIDPDGEELVKKLWVDENTLLYGDMESIIKAGTTGIKVFATPTDSTPFEGANDNVHTLHLISNLTE